jgi:hypothetical protein
MAHNALHPARLTIKLVLFFLSTVFALQANATITLTSVTNASNTGDLTESTPKIYGGVAGSLGSGHGTCESPDGTATCNSCWNNPAGAGTDARFEPCNTNRIYPNLQITFVFTSDKAAGKPILTTDDDTPVKIEPVDDPGTIAKGATATVTYLWKDICAGLDGGSGGACATGLDDTLKLGIDADDNDELDETGDDPKNIQVIVSDGGFTAPSIIGACGTGIGICEFDTAPGDGKVKVGLLESDSGFPTSGTLDFKNVVFFLSEVGFLDISPASSYVPLAIETSEDDTSTFSLESEIIDGLTNETAYWFKAAVQDIAMNVGLFTSDAISITTGTHDCFTTTPINTPPCHSARPGAVVGILSEDVNCFVATAAYGSSMASQVSMLRKFRNKFLITNEPGVKFVKWYYKYGPYAARFIAENETLRFAARIALSPFVAFAWVAVKFGFLAALALMTLIFALPIIYVRSREHQTSRINE